MDGGAKRPGSARKGKGKRGEEKMELAKERSLEVNQTREGVRESVLGG